MYVSTSISVYLALSIQTDGQLKEKPGLRITKTLYVGFYFDFSHHIRFYGSFARF